jgi:hypothetical protein
MVEVHNLEFPSGGKCGSVQRFFVLKIEAVKI